MTTKPKAKKNEAITLEHLATTIKRDFLAIWKNMATTENLAELQKNMATDQDLQCCNH